MTPHTTPEQPDQATVIHELLSTIEDMRDFAKLAGDDTREEALNEHGDPASDRDLLSAIAARGDRTLSKQGWD